MCQGVHLLHWPRSLCLEIRNFIVSVTLRIWLRPTQPLLIPKVKMATLITMFKDLDPWNQQLLCSKWKARGLGDFWPRKFPIRKTDSMWKPFATTLAHEAHIVGRNYHFLVTNCCTLTSGVIIMWWAYQQAGNVESLPWRQNNKDDSEN